jgi:uncharacterized small protein (DUF1192 family)
MIAVHIYGSIDLAVFCVNELQQRGDAAQDAVERLRQLVE